MSSNWFYAGFPLSARQHETRTRMRRVHLSHLTLPIDLFLSRLIAFGNMLVNHTAGCTLSPSGFSEILEWEFHKTGLWVRLTTLLPSSSFWCVTRGDSQARHKTLWLRHHGLLKKREPTRRGTSAWGYTRASEANVSIYIIVLMLFRVLSVRVYSRHTESKETNVSPRYWSYCEYTLIQFLNRFYRTNGKFSTVSCVLRVVPLNFAS